jgi:hypothetical protein
MNTAKIEIRLSPDEKGRALARASRLKLTLSAYVRRLLRFDEITQTLSKPEPHRQSDPLPKPPGYLADSPANDHGEQRTSDK